MLYYCLSGAGCVLLFLTQAQVSAALPIFLATGVERERACWEGGLSRMCVRVGWGNKKGTEGCVGLIGIVFVLQLQPQLQRRVPLAGFRCVYDLSNSHRLYFYSFYKKRISFCFSCSVFS